MGMIGVTVMGSREGAMILPTLLTLNPSGSEEPTAKPSQSATSSTATPNSNARSNPSSS